MQQTKRIGSLDAWRFIAVSMVIVGHAVSHTALDAILHKWPFLTRIYRFGTAGVYVFFVISGFVICRGLLHAGFHGFYTRRAFRILPPLWLYLAAVGGLSAAGVLTVSWSQIQYAGLFLCNLGPDCTWNAQHTWSLGYEEQFYLAFPLFLLALGRRAVAPALGVALVLSLAARAAGQQFAAEYLAMFVFLLTGCAAAVHEEWLRTIRAHVTTERWFVLGFVAVAAIWLVPNEVEPLVHTILYPFLVLVLLFSTPSLRFFESKTIQHAGVISYTVYLWQQLATARWEGLPWWGTILLIAAVWVWAVVSWRYFEFPLVRLARRLGGATPLPTEPRNEPPKSGPHAAARR